MKEAICDKPIITDKPVLLQLPPLVNCPNTSLGLVVGAKTHNGIIIAKRPSICMRNRNPSTMGSFLARNVLKMIANKAMAMTKSVPW
jgi:hypothetical protein